MISRLSTEITLVNGNAGIRSPQSEIRVRAQGMGQDGVPIATLTWRKSPSELDNAVPEIDRAGRELRRIG